MKELELPVAATSVGVSYVSQFLFPKNRFHIPVVQINPSSNGWGRILQSYNYYLPLLLLWYLIWKLFPGLMQFFCSLCFLLYFVFCIPQTFGHFSFVFLQICGGFTPSTWVSTTTFFFHWINTDFLQFCSVLTKYKNVSRTHFGSSS